jgi:amino acid transporter
MAANVGGAFWTSFVVGVGAAMLTGFAYAELITKYPHAAGAAMYAGRAFNSRFFTFLVAFCTVAASLAATGALALAFESVVVVCLVMLLIGVGLYFVNNLAQRRLDPALRRGGREGGS